MLLSWDRANREKEKNWRFDDRNTGSFLSLSLSLSLPLSLPLSLSLFSRFNTKVYIRTLQSLNYHCTKYVGPHPWKVEPQNLLYNYFTFFYKLYMNLFTSYHLNHMKSTEYFNYNKVSLSVHHNLDLPKLSKA